MTKEISIQNIAVFLPEKTITNHLLENEFPEWGVDKISQKTGIYKRHVAGEFEFALDMAKNSIDKLFADDSSISRNEVDFLIYVTQSPDFNIPTNACILQHMAGLPLTAGSFDVNLGCSGYVYGLSMAYGLLASRQARNILLVTSETYSKYIHKADKGNRTLFGDAATATLIGDKKRDDDLMSFSFLDANFFTDGSNYDKLIVKNSGFRHKSKTADLKNTNDVNIDDYLFMDGKAIFEFTNLVVPRLVNELLQRNKLAKEDVSLFLFHQANSFMIQALKRRMELKDEQYFFDIKNEGNTVSATIPIALKKIKESKKMKKGDVVLLSGFGVGLSVANMLLEVL